MTVNYPSSVFLQKIRVSSIIALTLFIFTLLSLEGEGGLDLWTMLLPNDIVVVMLWPMTLVLMILVHDDICT